MTTEETTEETTTPRIRTVADIRASAERLLARKARTRGINYWIRQIVGGENLGRILAEHRTFEDTLEDCRRISLPNVVIRLSDLKPVTFPRGKLLTAADVDRLLKRLERARPAETPDPSEIAVAVDENAPLAMEIP